jgi:hypothetical protein
VAYIFNSSNTILVGKKVRQHVTEKPKGQVKHATKPKTSNDRELTRNNMHNPKTSDASTSKNQFTSEPENEYDHNV